MTTSLHIEERREGVKPDTLRGAGKIPAVLYGPKEKTISITLDRAAFEKVWRSAGETTIIDLEGVGETKEALIHQVDFHPVTDVPQHADFYVVEKGKKVQIDIPIVFVGESPAVKNLGGTLMKAMYEIKVEALPKDLPHEIEVDISKLVTFEDQIAIKDIAVPNAVTVLADAEDTVASIAQPTEEVEEVPVAIDMDSIEVEKKGKQEEEGAAEAPAESKEE